jgi:hypothetical protein
MAENPAFEAEEYDDPIAEAETILSGLVECYEDYRDRVNPDAPPLPSVVPRDDE